MAHDAAKKTVGRKRHIAVDTEGRLLMVNLTRADISDSAGAHLDTLEEPPDPGRFVIHSCCDRREAANAGSGWVLGYR